LVQTGGGPVIIVYGILSESELLLAGCKGAEKWRRMEQDGDVVRKRAVIIMERVEERSVG
jgi:hypothetical protein